MSGRSQQLVGGGGSRGPSSWFDRLSGARSFAVLHLLWGEDPSATFLLGILVASQVLAELGILILLALAIGDLATPTSSRNGLDEGLLLILIGIGVLYVVRHLLAPFASALAASLDHRMRASAGAALIRIALAPVGIAHLEDRAVANELEGARGVSLEAAFKSRVVSLYVEALGQRLRLAALAVVLAWFAWWAALLFAIGVLLYYGWARREVFTFLRGHGVATETFRRAAYFFDVAVDRAMAKEVRLFGLGDWLVDNFRVFQQAGLQQIHRRHSSLALLIAVSSAASLSIGTVFVAILLDAQAGNLDIGGAALLAGALLIGSGALLSGEAWVWGLAAAPYGRLVQIQRVSGPRSQSTHRPAERLRDRLQVEHLAFGYPGGPTVLRDLSFTVRRGESAAIVGRNGAGKTTLVKLLCRLYEPDSGLISVDGHDLSRLDATSWRSQLSVVFQDFVRYPLSARDNISLGRAVDDADLRRAAEQAQATDMLAGLRAGWDTFLTPSYPGGADLSGGEWQRLVLARAIAAVTGGATLLILDEPTANLDAEAEAAFNERLLGKMSGVTTILISHRFPTVRRVDRIYVLEGGAVAEAGSHDDLMAADGLYAHMFRTQAARFEADKHA